MKSPDANLSKVHLSTQVPLGKATDSCTTQNGEASGGRARENQIPMALIQAQKMQALGSLAGGLAHDFNNVFAAILLQLDLMCNQTELSPAMSEDLEGAKMSAKRGADLVKRLLEFSRPKPRHVHVLHPYEVVQETLALLERTITRRIRISLVAAPDPWRIKGDENQIRLILVMLCLHARDAMPGGGSIAVEISNVTRDAKAETVSPRDFICLSVKDSSPGMTKSTAGRLFEPHFVTKECLKGSGLSLSLVKGIVLEHDGWIEVESTEKGTQFKVFLPRDASLPQSIETKIPRKSKASLEGTETILVVDSETMMRDLFRAVLSYRGYQVVEACNYQEAFEKFATASTPIDLMIFNSEALHDPGFEALTRIKEQKPGMQTIFCGASDPDTSAKALSAGAQQILPKPFSNPDLVHMVRETLNARRA